MEMRKVWLRTYLCKWPRYLRLYEVLTPRGVQRGLYGEFHRTYKCPDPHPTRERFAHYKLDLKVTFKVGPRGT